MSQLASAYSISTATLEALAGLAEAKRFDELWSRLRAEGREVLPPFDLYSGDVVVLAQEYLGEAEVDFPLATHPAAKKLNDTGLAPLLIAHREEAAQLSAQIGARTPEDGELRSWFADFTGDHWDEAPQAMRAAFDYLKRALDQTTAAEPWCMLLIG